MDNLQKINKDDEDLRHSLQTASYGNDGVSNTQKFVFIKVYLQLSANEFKNLLQKLSILFWQFSCLTFILNFFLRSKINLLSFK